MNHLALMLGLVISVPPPPPPPPSDWKSRAAGQTEVGRFELTAARVDNISAVDGATVTSNSVIKIDTATGRTWKLLPYFGEHKGRGMDWQWSEIDPNH